MTTWTLLYYGNKAVLEPRVSPAFSITYFCNHCNIRFDPIPKLGWKVIDPWMTFDPKSAEVTCVTLPKDHCFQVPWKYIKVRGYSDPFFKNLNQRSLTPRWPLTPRLLRSHAWLYPRIIVSKSHEKTSMYVDTMVNFAKYHMLQQWYIHYTYYYYIHNTYRMSDHMVSFWTQFRRGNKNKGSIKTVFVMEYKAYLTSKAYKNSLNMLPIDGWILITKQHSVP